MRLLLPAMSWSISASLGMKGILRITEYVGASQVPPVIFRNEEYASTALFFDHRSRSALRLSFLLIQGRKDLRLVVQVVAAA